MPPNQSVLVLLLSPGELYHAEGSAEVVEVVEEAVVVAERCLVDCWMARAPPPSAGAPPAWASRDVLPGVLARLTGRAILVQPEPDRPRGSSGPSRPSGPSPKDPQQQRRHRPLQNKLAGHTRQ